MPSPPSANLGEGDQVFGVAGGLADLPFKDGLTVQSHLHQACAAVRVDARLVVVLWRKQGDGIVNGWMNEWMGG